jgi:integrase
MGTRKRWSRSVGARRGNRARIYEREPGGMLYCTVWIPGRGKSRRSLGHGDRERALRDVEELLSLRARGEVTPVRQLTLGALCDQYLAQHGTGMDGCLKTERYRRDCERRATLLRDWFGGSTPVEDITPARAMQYARVRRLGQGSHRAVRTRSVQLDLKLLKSICRWGAVTCVHGAPLLARNPLEGLSIPRERDPRRPSLSNEDVQKLLGVAQEVHPQLPLLMALMECTGRRLSSVLGLRWDDIDLQRGTIQWRPELDKRRRSWVTPLPERMRPILVEARLRMPSIGKALLFPSTRDATVPVARHLAAYWLKRAFVAAKIQRPLGGLWHCFRRKWATDRKDFPLKDVAAVGGWGDVTTLLICSQQPDATHRLWVRLLVAIEDRLRIPLPAQ